MLLMANAEKPVFVSVAACAALGVPINWGAKLRLAGERLRLSSCNRMEIGVLVLSRFAIAKSSLPSSLKSPIATETGVVPAGKFTRV
jgi:hypothetical protein